MMKFTTNKKGKGGKVSQNKQSQKIVTLSGLHPDLLEGVKSKIKFANVRKSLMREPEVILLSSKLKTKLDQKNQKEVSEQ